MRQAQESYRSICPCLAAYVGRLGIPSALAFGLIYGLTEFVPVVGPIAGADPVILVAIGQSWEMTRVNMHAMFYLSKAAVRHMKPGSPIINTVSINSDQPNPILLAYATSKGAIHNFTGGLAQLFNEKEIRVNAVVPGPVWTPLIPSTLPEDSVSSFGKQVPLKRPAQPAELATAYVMLADPQSSYVSGATIAVTGGKPFL
jgi:NAD(P)-dependent dehydrogenase (short-subunit alcohol dehydrogenase family)